MRFLRNRQANYRRNIARDSCVTDKKTTEETVREILAWQKSKLRKRQCARFLHNRLTNPGNKLCARFSHDRQAIYTRNNTRDSCVTDQQIKEETVREILAQQISKLQKKQCARFLRNWQTIYKRNNTRDSCIIDKKTIEETVREILAQQTNKPRE